MSEVIHCKCHMLSFKLLSLTSKGRTPLRRPTCKTIHQQRPRSEYDETEFTYCQRGRGEFRVLIKLKKKFASESFFNFYFFLFVQHLCPIRCYEEKRHTILNHFALL